MSDLVRFLSLFAAFFIIAGLLIVFGVFDRCSRSASEAAIAEEIRDIPPSFNITASQLVQTYKADEQSVAAAYNGSVGIVGGPTWTNETAGYLKLRTYDIWGVRCFASDEVIDKVNVLSRSGNWREGGVAKMYGSGELFDTSPVFAFKGRVEGVNDKRLTIDLRGCTLQDLP